MASTGAAPNSATIGSLSTQANATGGGVSAGNTRFNRRGNRNSNGGTRGAGRGSTIAPNSGGTTTNKTVFKGTVSEMNGHVFECIGERATRPQFVKTLEALRDYVKIKMAPYSDDLNPLFGTTMSAPEIIAPARPTVGADALVIFDYQEDKKDYNKRAAALKGNLAALFAVIWGQCSEPLRSKLKALPGYSAALGSNDCFWLLQQVRSIVLNFDSTKHPVLSLQEALYNYLGCSQRPHETTEVFMESVRAWAESIEAYGGSVVGMDKPSKPTVVSAGADDAIVTSSNVAQDHATWYTEARERSMAMVLIRGADPARYGSLRKDLQNSFGQGVDRYPKDLTSAYNYLLSYEAPVNSNKPGQNVIAQPANKPVSSPTSVNGPSGTVAPEAKAMTFAQVADHSPVPGDDGKLFTNILCFKCHRQGHFANHCPGGEDTASGTTLFQYNLTQARNDISLDARWILLDTQSTISVFRNAAMLRNIRPSDTVLRAVTNGGSQEHRYVGEFPNLGTVWYNPDSIANILSLADVRRVCRITMDTDSEPAMSVHRLDGSIMKFVEFENGLYIFAPNVSEPVNVYSLLQTVDDDTVLLQTVEEQKRLFTKRQVDAADAARALYRKLGRPSEAEFQHILQSNLVRNCPVTPDDAKRALIIYGPDVAALKGTTRRSPDAPHVPSFHAVPIPAPILEHHRQVTLCADFFFVQQIPFFHSISRGIRFRTTSPVADRTKSTILREVRAVVKLYESRGFSVEDLHCDSDFACARTDLLPIRLDVVPPDSHVGEVERSIQTIKGRLRSAVHGLPFKRLPKLMITELVANTVRCLNQFPHKNGVSQTMSPATIITGSPLPDFHHMALEFGSYVQIFEDNTPSNTLHSRSLGAIALGPTGNSNGDYFFLSLATGRRVSRHSWIELPIPDTAIARVEALGLLDNMPLIQEDGLVVEWRPDFPIADDEYDRDFPPPRLLPDIPLHPDFLPIQEDELLSLASSPLPVDDLSLSSSQDQGAQTAEGSIDDNKMNTEEEGDIAEEEGADQEEGDIAEEEGAELDSHQDVDAQDNNQGQEEQGDPIENEDLTMGAGPTDEDEGATEPEELRSVGYNLRPRGQDPGRGNFVQAIDEPHSSKSYFPPVQFLQDKEQINDPIRAVIHAHVLTQMSERAGLEKHGKAAEEALLREFPSNCTRLEYRRLGIPPCPSLSSEAKERKNTAKQLRTPGNHDTLPD